jgi:serine/threonine protein kinase
MEKRLLKPELREAYFHEINIMRKLEHPNIINVHEFFQDDDRIYIVMPICKGKTLFTACNARKKDKSSKGRWTEK